MGSHRRGGPPGRRPSGPGRPPRGGGGERAPSIWPPERVQGILANGVVHPSYRLDVFCRMKEENGKFEPKQKKGDIYRQTIQAVKARAEVATHWRKRRQSWLGPLVAQGLASTLVVKAHSRVVLWLSSPSATELGFCLHHVYGIPFLPPSGLKGLASMAQWRAVDPGFSRSSPAGPNQPPCPPREVLDLFGEGGDHGHEGRVAFLDGIPIGNDAGHILLDDDVMTPHHPAYYGDRLNHPHDCEGPNPLPFLCIPPGQRFEIGLVFTRGPSAGGRGPSHWLREAQQWLLSGLDEMGLGAKTTSGYGRFLPPGRATQGGSSGGSPGSAPPCPGPAGNSATQGAPSGDSPGPESGRRKVLATVVTTDRRTAQGVARDEAGHEFSFGCSLLSSRLPLYPQQWATLHGSRLVFIFEGDNVVSVEREEAS